MDFEISEEQEELRQSVRTVLEQECPLGLVRGLLEGAAAPEQPWKSAVELGWPAIAVPEACGGLGLGFQELGLVVEEHGRFLAPGPFLATATQFLPLVLEAGDERQRQRFAAGVARGEITGALAVAGATGRGPAPDDALRARRDGDDWVLDGARHFVPDGATADVVAAAARVAEGDGVGLFLVRREALLAAPVASLDPSRPLSTLRFESVRVPPEQVLGVPGQSAPALDRALQAARVALALEMVGTCQALLDVSVDYATQRVQFDVPIGTFQAVQHKCTDMFVAVEKARAIAHFAMMTIGEDDPRRGLAASMAKAAAGECESLVCQDAIQLHGGTGFTWECDVHLFVRRAKTGGSLLGTASEHRLRIADELEL